MEQLLIEKIKNNITDSRIGIIECKEIPKCPKCKREMQFQENRVFTQKVYWNCGNSNCEAGLFMRIKMGDRYFLIKL